MLGKQRIQNLKAAKVCRISWPCSCVWFQIKSALQIIQASCFGSRLWSSFGACRLDFFPVKQPEAVESTSAITGHPVFVNRVEQI